MKTDEMNEQEINAVAITIGLLLDEMQRHDPEDRGRLHKSAITGIGQLLAERGGLGLMAKVMDLVLDQKPEAESWRENVIDHAFSGFGNWGS